MSDARRSPTESARRGPAPSCSGSPCAAAARRASRCGARASTDDRPHAASHRARPRRDRRHDQDRLRHAEQGDLGRRRRLRRAPTRATPRPRSTAMVKYVNANGGVAGDTIAPVVRTFESSTDSPADRVRAVQRVHQGRQGLRGRHGRAAAPRRAHVLQEGEHRHGRHRRQLARPAATSRTTSRTTGRSTAARRSTRRSRPLVPTAQGARLLRRRRQGRRHRREDARTYERLVEDVLKPAVVKAGSEVSVVTTIDQSTPDNAAATSRRRGVDVQGRGSHAPAVRRPPGQLRLLHRHGASRRSTSRAWL